MKNMTKQQLIIELLSNKTVDGKITAYFEIKKRFKYRNLIYNGHLLDITSLTDNHVYNFKEELTNLLNECYWVTMKHVGYTTIGKLYKICCTKNTKSIRFDS